MTFNGSSGKIERIVFWLAMVALGIIGFLAQYYTARVQDQIDDLVREQRRMAARESDLNDMSSDIKSLRTTVEEMRQDIRTMRTEAQ